MPPATSATHEDEPVHIELELVRAEAADDAFAFRFARQTYLIRGPGGAYETAELPWSRELLRDLDEVRRPDRDPAVVARVGDMLRELLGAAGWARHEAAIVEARAARRRVHLTIRSAAAELYALPWELLTLRADGQHLGALEHVLLRYAWPGTATVTTPLVNDGDPCTLDACVGGVVSNTFQDADSDGICDANDPCPNLANLQNGDPCDDGDACTTGDIVAACVCAGTFQDTDLDGICDANDDCPTVPGEQGDALSLIHI